MRGKFLLFLVLLAFGGLVRATFYLHRDNAKLATQAGALRSLRAPLGQLEEENRRTREVLARAKADSGAADAAVHDEAVRLQAEVGELERRAQASSDRKAAAKAVEEAALATNRDPERAFMRLEYFQNAGRGTPMAAMQTLIWAAVKGDERELSATISMMGDARESAERLLAKLPDAARAKYPAPESLAALVVMNEILRTDALQISPKGEMAGYALITLKVAQSDDDTTVPMERTPDGWKAVIPKKLISILENKLKPPPAAGPKK